MSEKILRLENITMQFNTALSPCLIRPLTGAAYEYLVHPVRNTNN